MAQLHELIPNAEVLLSIEPEELAGALLEVLNSNAAYAGDVHPGNFTTEILGAVHQEHFPQGNREAIAHAIMEAVGWLEGQGLIARVPDPGNYGTGWHFVTRRGRAIENSGALMDYRRASLLPKDLLHPRIAEKCWIVFIRGDYDTAVFQAFKEVEIAVRAAAGYADADIGVPLMRKAFHVENGPLSDQDQIRGERQALQDLFAGGIGSYKNPHSHRMVAIIDPADAVEMIMLASHLLRIVDARRDFHRRAPNER